MRLACLISMLLLSPDLFYFRCPASVWEAAVAAGEEDDERDAQDVAAAAAAAAAALWRESAPSSMSSPSSFASSPPFSAALREGTNANRTGETRPRGNERARSGGVENEDDAGRVGRQAVRPERAAEPSASNTTPTVPAAGLPTAMAVDSAVDRAEKNVRFIV